MKRGFLRFLDRFEIVVFLLLGVAGLICLCAGLVFFFALRDLPRVPDPLSRISKTPPTEIFAANGERVLVLGGREYVPLGRVSHHFINAILATEDHRFYDHHGVDKVRFLKAAWITLFHPGRVQGASTITQQLAKNLFFSFRQTYTRKLRELLVAVQIESQFSKNEILEAYINQIPFGVGAHGVEAASRLFFGKPASELTLEEASLLAGLPKSPSRYNPFRHMQRAKKRQRIVLGRMVATGMIAQANADEAFAAQLELVHRRPGHQTGSYFLDLVLKTLEERYGSEVVYHGGLKVTTTLDTRLQFMAESVIEGGLEKLESVIIGKKKGAAVALKNDAAPKPAKERLQGALVALETRSGAVRAIVGGRNYFETEYNRAVKSGRLAGSAFKPFLYYTAFENAGLSPASVLEDKPIRIPVKGAPDWEPRNFKRSHQGTMVLKSAFVDSVNTIAAQLVTKTQPQAVIDTAQRCGINSPLKPVYSIALGTSGVSPLQMASAYATFATGGVRHESFWIRRVEDATGQVLEEHIVSRQRALDAAIAYQVVDMMTGVIDDGTGEIIRRMGFKLTAAGKTGTTNGFKDAWFTGFTPSLCTSVWVGYDKEKGMIDRNRVGVTGGRGAAPIWADFMKRATEGSSERVFAKPEEIHFTNVNPTSGEKAVFFSRNTIRVALRKGQ
jgi:penicillin-binding protein 1A